jgi:acid phosphatase family membrane protein YuiD
LTYNYILVAAIVSWTVAQILKTIINFLITKQFKAERLVGSGGMPSSHSAFVTAGLVATGRLLGLGDPIFAVMFIIFCVVVYDALNVRYNAGLHANELNKINDMFFKIPEMLALLGGTPEDRRRLKEYLGHTPLEVVCGIILGISFSFVLPMEVANA